MSFLNAAVFGTIMAAAVFSLDYYLYAQKSAEPAATGTSVATSYFDDVRQRIASTVKPAAPDPDALATYLPEPPEGMIRRPYRPSDGEAVTGQSYRHSITSVDTTNDLLGALNQRRRDKAFIVETYTSGGEDRIVLRVSLHEPEATETPPDPAVASGAGHDHPVFGSVNGVIFRTLPQTSLDTKSRTETPVAYRRIQADLGGTLDLMVVTNAADPEVRAVLGAIDMAGLMAKAGLTGAARDDALPPVADAPAAALSEPAAPPPAAAVERKADTALVQTMAARKVAMPAQPEGVCVRRAGKLVCE
jgi:hypothetical protein